MKKDARAGIGFPNGHFYSPVVDQKEAEQQQARIWPDSPRIYGIDFDDDQHHRILTKIFPAFIKDYDYPEELQDTNDLARFYTRNTQFGWLDSRALFVLLRRLRPRHVIEVGSGYSSLLMADVNNRFNANATSITCIEPYPRPFLRRGIAGIYAVIEKNVQEVPVELFESLEAGDVLFIDSSHVSKTGSDVNHLFFEILPRLVKGVVIHIHDIFLPHDYKKEWVLCDGRSWNEQYLLRALLMYSSAFRVMFGSSYAYYRFPELVKAALNLPSGASFAGGSFWIEKVQ